MTKEEFLAKVGLHEAEFRDLLRKFGRFEESLNAAQQAALQRSMRTRPEALHSLNEGLTPAKLTKILKEIGVVGGPDEDPGNRNGGQFDGRSILAAKVNVKKSKSEG